jgi:hypothetical protein
LFSFHTLAIPAIAKVEYFKEQRAMRTETSNNHPKACAINKESAHLASLQQQAASGHPEINRPLLDAQPGSLASVLSSQPLAHRVQPTIPAAAQHAPALRLGQPRSMALFHARTSFSHLAQGLTNRSLRPQVADFLDLDV